MFTLINNVIRNFLHRPATRRYPFEKREPFAGARGHLVIDPATCVYCGICATKCPANALAVSRDPKSWTLDPYKCILCGYCIESCPKKCLSMNPHHREP
ncbi:4Fe-4S binding protein [bacterium]|nr:4Fe-4S binding protein [bacterium]